MLLISPEFGAFFLLFLLAWWLLKPWPQGQNGLLAAASFSLLWYYTPSSQALFVLLAVIFWVWLIGLPLKRDGRRRLLWLWLGIGGAMVNLAFWKYAENLRPFARQALADQDMESALLASAWVLPLGLSYYTFQGIAWLVACYRGDAATQRMGLFGLGVYLSSFLTITSGPIARPDSNNNGLTGYDGQACDAASQLATRAPRRMLSPSLALTLILLAVFKVWALAGWLDSGIVTPVFSDPERHHALDVLAAIYGYTLQLLFNFSGYSELVLGLAMLLGLRLPVNFRLPLLAHNLREFWNQWHISLSTWIRDHVYFPLGNKDQPFPRRMLNLLLAMGFSGLWHASGWSLNFILWGLLHGIGLVLLNIGDRVAARWCRIGSGKDSLRNSHPAGKALGIFCTVQFVVFAFVLFRTHDLEETRVLFAALGGNWANVPVSAHTLPLLAALLILWPLWRVLHGLPEKFAAGVERLPILLRPLPLIVIFVLVVALSPSGMPNFIYANF
jgi:D-alanyl-lipoteichoic acid acyltransferase DltB (MBOAT superfamily)